MLSTNKMIPSIPAMVVLLAFTPPSIPTSPIAGKHTKARLIEEVPKMQRLALKKVKGLSSEESVVCNDLVLALPVKIQDQGLEVISECRDTLKNMATEELDRQVPLMDETESKIDKATSDLKNTRMLGLRTRLTSVLKK